MNIAILVLRVYHLYWKLAYRQVRAMSWRAFIKTANADYKSPTPILLENPVAFYCSLQFCLFLHLKIHLSSKFMVSHIQLVRALVQVWQVAEFINHSSFTSMLPLYNQSSYNFVDHFMDKHILVRVYIVLAAAFRDCFFLCNVLDYFWTF